MTPEGHNDLFPALEAILKEADEPMDCHQLFDRPEVRAVAPSVDRVSDYLGVLFRRGLLSRVANEPGANTRARWAYLWKNKQLPDWKKPKEVVDYRPKAVLDRPNIYITEDGDHVHIEMPELSITIKKKK